jgi:hypothetical protein
LAVGLFDGNAMRSMAAFAYRLFVSLAIVVTLPFIAACAPAATADRQVTGGIGFAPTPLAPRTPDPKQYVLTERDLPPRIWNPAKETGYELNARGEQFGYLAEFATDASDPPYLLIRTKVYLIDSVEIARSVFPQLMVQDLGQALGYKSILPLPVSDIADQSLGYRSDYVSSGGLPYVTNMVAVRKGRIIAMAESVSPAESEFSFDSVVDLARVLASRLP